MVVNIILIIVLILINGVFAASESALVAINHNRLRDDVEKANKRAIKTSKFVHNPTNFLSTIQIGITFIGFINAIIVSDAFTDKIVNYFVTVITIEPSVLRPIVTVLLTLILTYFQVVLGELVPKRIAMRYPRKVSYLFVGLNSFLSVVMKPLVWLLTSSANLIIKILGINVEEAEDRYSEQEIRLMIDAGKKTGTIDNTESEMIENIFEWDDTVVSEIMTHRTEIIAINIESTKNEVINIVSKERFTRFPIYEDNIDNIVGTIHSKDLLAYLDNMNKQEFDLKKLVRKAMFIPKRKIVSELFVEMKQTKQHIAIVIDEFGGTAGIVTMEDILEQIVGNIFDEYDDNIEEIKHLGEGIYEINGLSSLENVEDILMIDLPYDDYDTLSGFMIGKLQRLPRKGEKPEIIFNGYSFKAIDLDTKVINRVLVTKLNNKNLSNDTQ